MHYLQIQRLTSPFNIFYIQLLLANIRFEMAPEGEEKKPIVLTDETFDDFVNGNKASIIDCWAAWCFPCRMLSPVIDQLAEEHKEIAFGKLNVDENPKIPLRYGIMAIPTLLYFKDGKLVNKEAGALPKDALENRMSKLLT